jgi:hypothetical protein
VAFADAAVVGIELGRFQAPLGDLGDAGVEVADEDGVHGVPGMFGPHLATHEARRLGSGGCVLSGSGQCSAGQIGYI